MPLLFACYNVNCYSKFKTQKGLSLHLAHNPACQHYVAHCQRPVATNPQTTPFAAASLRRVTLAKLQQSNWYGTHAQRLNPFMPSERTVMPLNSQVMQSQLHNHNSITNVSNMHAQLLSNCTQTQETDDFPNDEDTNPNYDLETSDINQPLAASDTNIILHEAGAQHVGMSTSSRHMLNTEMAQRKTAEQTFICLLQYDIEHRSIVDLLVLLEGCQSPDYLLERVLHWANEAHRNGFDFAPKAYTREANIQWMYKTLANSHNALPQLIRIDLDDNGISSSQDIVCFDFATALLSLLNDDKLMQPANLLLNAVNPCAMYAAPDNRIGEANSARRYQELYHNLITKPNQLLVPIIMFLDGTAIDSKGHIELCPVSFTTSLFIEPVRRDVLAWRVLGYVPDLNRRRSNAMNASSNKRNQKGRTTRNFHSVMDVILQGMVTAQSGTDARLCNVPLRLNGMWYTVDIVCPLLFVINDGKQGDQLCCRFSGHHANTRRHHRSCHCEYEDLDQPHLECTFLTTEGITELCQVGSEDDLKAMSIYRVDNAFNRVQMGPNPHGIYGCAVIDIMHSLQHGLMMYALSAFTRHIPDKQLAFIDQMAIDMDLSCRQSCRPNYPRADFGRGISNLTQIECTERSGAVFVFTALMMHEKGWEHMAPCFDNPEAVLGALECLLLFEAWLNKETYWTADDHDVESPLATNAIVEFLTMLKTYLPRIEGNGWKLSKYHEMIHVVRFINEFGALRGYNASRPEEHHKKHAKQPGRRSQKKVSTIDLQCGQRLADASIIDTMHALFHPDLSSQVAEGDHDANIPATDGRYRECHGGTRYMVTAYVDAQTLRLCCKVSFITKTTSSLVLEPNLHIFLMQYYSDEFTDQGEGCIACCTEYHKFDMRRHGTSEQLLIAIRCHPNYRGEGAWYDWAIIRFEDEAGLITDYPSRVVSCVIRTQPLPEPHVNGNVEDSHTQTPQPEFDLVVQCCTTTTKHESLLYDEWMFSTDFYVVPATAVVASCFVLSACFDKSRVLVVKDETTWSNLFYAGANMEYNN